MTNKEAKKKVDYVLLNSSATIEDYNKLEKFLFWYKYQNEEFAYKSLARLYLKLDEISNAKKYAMKCLEVNDKCLSAYNLLYRIFTSEENYEEALKSLKIYKKLSEDIGKNNNYDLAIIMLEALSDMKKDYTKSLNISYEMECPTIFGNYEIDDIIVEGLYEDAFKCLANRNYRELKKDLMGINQLCLRHNYSMNVVPLISVSEALIKREEECVSNKIYNKEYDFLEEYDVSVDTVKDSYVDEKLTLGSLLDYIDILISTNFSKACNLFSAVEDYLPVDDRIKLVKGKINEKLLLANLDDENKDIYNRCLKNGRELCLKYNFNDALENFMMGFNITEHPIFKYYIGKAYFKAHNYDMACKYFESYIDDGGAKLNKAYFYMSVISAKSNDKHNMVKYNSKIKELSMTFNSEKEFKCPSYNFKSNSLYFQKKRTSQKLKQQNIKFVNLDDITEKIIGLPFDEKLKITRSYYEQGQIAVGDRLIKELETLTANNPKDRSKVNKEKGKRMIYLKNKHNA